MLRTRPIAPKDQKRSGAGMGGQRERIFRDFARTFWILLAALLLSRLIKSPNPQVLLSVLQAILHFSANCSQLRASALHAVTCTMKQTN